MNLEKKITKNEETEIINNVSAGVKSPMNEETQIINNVNAKAKSPLNEETQIISGAGAAKPGAAASSAKFASASAAAAKAKAAKAPGEKNNKVNWSKVAIGGVVGLALGSAGVVAANEYLTSDTGVEGVILDEDNNTLGEGEGETGTEETPVETTLEVEVTISSNSEEVLLAGTPYGVDTSVDVASVSDNMSFGEAFAEARGQVGPGGVFVWNGGIYSTYQAEEWDSMSLAQREEFGEQISYHARSTSNYAENTTTSEASDDFISYDNSDTDEINIVEAQATDSSDSEVQILGVTETIADDGSLLTVGQVEIDGQEVFLIDTDQDGLFDVIAGDFNNDGYIAENEIDSYEDCGLTVDDLELNMDIQNDQYFADAGPDYINDDFNLV
ncbi:MAG: hypothetical protein R3Y51_01000 [Rikenellaceae bacterium]